ncbi:MAG: hypothetical protein PHV82_13790 [Victivallaceae bacterium]|nr:hypothetical protein [Victivallaceae bacterium]
MNKLIKHCRSNIINIIVPKASFRHAENKPAVVERNQEPYWKQRGWGKSGDRFYGFFRTKFGSFRGQARISPSRQTKLYIRNPPECLKKHDHWACFVKENNGWFFIHNYNDGEFDLSSGIIQIEQILTEAFNL